MNKPSASFQPLHFAQKRPEEWWINPLAFHGSMRTRRTVRHFSQRPIPMEVVENALRSGDRVERRQPTAVAFCRHYGA